DHRLDVPRMAAVLRAVSGVDRVVELIACVGERDVLLDAASADVRLMRRLGGAVPAAVGPAPRADKEVVTDANDPDRQRPARRAVAPLGGDLQLLGPADPVELVGGPVRRRHGRTITLIDSRSAI